MQNINSYILLARYLKIKGCFGQFRYNYMQAQNKPVWAMHHRKLNKNNATCQALLNYAFSWAETKEGYDFWKKIYNDLVNIDACRFANTYGEI